MSLEYQNKSITYLDLIDNCFIYISYFRWFDALEENYCKQNALAWILDRGQEDWGEHQALQFTDRNFVEKFF